MNKQPYQNNDIALSSTGAQHKESLAQYKLKRQHQIDDLKQRLSKVTAKPQLLSFQSATAQLCPNSPARSINSPFSQSLPPEEAADILQQLKQSLLSLETQTTSSLQRILEGSDYYQLRLNYLSQKSKGLPRILLNFQYFEQLVGEIQLRLNTQQQQQATQNSLQQSLIRRGQVYGNTGFISQIMKTAEEGIDFGAQAERVYNAQQQEIARLSGRIKEFEQGGGGMQTLQQVEKIFEFSRFISQVDKSNPDVVAQIGKYISKQEATVEQQLKEIKALKLQLKQRTLSFERKTGEVTTANEQLLYSNQQLISDKLESERKLSELADQNRKLQAMVYQYELELQGKNGENQGNTSQLVQTSQQLLLSQSVQALSSQKLALSEQMQTSEDQSTQQLIQNYEDKLRDLYGQLNQSRRKPVSYTDRSIGNSNNIENSTKLQQTEINVSNRATSPLIIDSQSQKYQSNGMPRNFVDRSAGSSQAYSTYDKPTNSQYEFDDQIQKQQLSISKYINNASYDANDSILSESKQQEEPRSAKTYTITEMQQTCKNNNILLEFSTFEELITQLQYNNQNDNLLTKIQQNIPQLAQSNNFSITHDIQLLITQQQSQIQFQKEETKVIKLEAKYQQLREYTKQKKEQCKLLETQLSEVKQQHQQLKQQFNTQYIKYLIKNSNKQTQYPIVEKLMSDEMKYLANELQQAQFMQPDMEKLKTIKELQQRQMLLQNAARALSHLVYYCLTVNREQNKQYENAGVLELFVAICQLGEQKALQKAGNRSIISQISQFLQQIAERQENVGNEIMDVVKWSKKIAGIE